MFLITQESVCNKRIQLSERISYEKYSKSTN